MSRTSCAPPPAEGGPWYAALHWCVSVMDVDDPDLGFTASLLSHAVQHDGLTARQAKYGQKIWQRLLGLYDRGQLPQRICRNTSDDLTDLGSAPMAGHA